MARNFFAAVSKWNMEIRGEVLVFDNGCWHKELFPSSMMRWIGKQSTESMDDVMTTQVEVLREQMKSVSTLITDEVDEPQVQAMLGPRMGMHIARLRGGM